MNPDWNDLPALNGSPTPTTDAPSLADIISGARITRNRAEATARRAAAVTRAAEGILAMEREGVISEDTRDDLTATMRHALDLASQV